MSGAHGEVMRIALVTEQFAPSTAPTAQVTREIVTRLTGGGHDVVVFAAGRGQSSFGAARLFWASRMTPVAAIRESLALSRPEVCHLIDPHRLGIKVAEAAERIGVPTLSLHPGVWGPGVDLADHHPGLRDEHLHDRWARLRHPDGGRLIVGFVGPLERTKVLNRLVTVARLPGVRLVAVGDGPGASALRAAGAKVIPHATGLERARCVASFDVLLQPRKKELYAPVVHEALASGVPVVAYDSGSSAGRGHPRAQRTARRRRTGAARPSRAPWPDSRRAPTCAYRWLPRPASRCATGPGTTRSPSCSRCTTPRRLRPASPGSVRLRRAPRPPNPGSRRFRHFIFRHEPKTPPRKARRS